MKPEPEKSDAKALVEMHSKLYAEQFGEPPDVSWPRDMKIATGLLALYPFAKLAEWLRAFFASTDDFIRNSGYTFPQFKFNLSKLITEQAAHISQKSWRTVTGIFGHPPERTPIRDAVYFLSTSFRTEIDMPQTRSYERALAELKDKPEILLEAAELLVNEAANGRQFYPIPKPSDLKGACAKVIEGMRVKAFQEGAVGCTHSSYLEELTRPDGTTYFQRCSCYQRGKLLSDAVAKPFALPAAGDLEKFEVA